MIRDDHDITDGWGSRTDSVVAQTSEFKPEWQRLFGTAFKMFSIMQTSRNPAPLADDPKDGLDFLLQGGSLGVRLPRPSNEQEPEAQEASYARTV